MNSVEKVKAICKERKIAIYKLEKDLGYGNAYISQLKKGTFPDDRLVEIANYLGVTTDYLLGTEEKPATNEGNGLSRDAVEMGRIFDAAVPEIRAQMKDVAEGKATAKVAVNIVDVKCPIDGTMQKIYQNVVQVGGKAYPSNQNNGCEMYHPCRECELCRMAAMFAELKGFGE